MKRLRRQAESHGEAINQCKLLRLPEVGSQCAGLLAELAVKEKQRHLDYLEALLAAEMEERERNTVQRRLRDAHLPRTREKLCAKPHPLGQPKQAGGHDEESNISRRTFRNPLIQPKHGMPGTSHLPLAALWQDSFRVRRDSGGTSVYFLRVLFLTSSPLSGDSSLRCARPEERFRLNPIRNLVGIHGPASTTDCL